MWKFVSEDENTISLHDMVINKIIIKNGVQFIFEGGFAVTKENANNITGKHKQSGESAVSLINGKYIAGINHDKGSIIEKELLDALVLEVLNFEWVKEKEKLIVFGNSLSSNGEVLELQFYCTYILFCWNDLFEDAWF